LARKRKGNKIDGWLVIDKPLEMGSTQVVGKVRWLTKAQKVGHGGTLDPLATGILPIALGEATKTIPFIMDARKTYAFTVRWGIARTTDDREGDICATHDHRPCEADILAALPGFIGRIKQRPPAYSAIKVDGKRSYDLARAGEEVVLKEREIDVFSLRLLSAEAEEATFEVDCGKGTYIRSLARDLALKLGTVGHVTMLRRLKVGSFGLKESISLVKLEELSHSAPPEEWILPVETVLDDILALAVTEDQAAFLSQGRKLAVPGPVAPGLVRIMCGPRLVALAQAEADKTRMEKPEEQVILRPVRVFNI